MTDKLESNNQTIEYYIHLASSHHHKGHFIEAITYYQKALNIDPERYDLYCSIGYLWKIQFNYHQSKLAYQKALNISPDCYSAHFALAEIYIALEQSTQALSIYEDYIRLSTTELLCKMEQAAQEDFKSPAIPDKAPSWLLQIIALAGKASIFNLSNQFDKSYQLLQPFIKSPYKNIQLGLSLATAALYLPKNHKPIQYLEDLIHNTQTGRTDKKNLWFKLGHLYDKNHQYSQAFHAFSQANQLNSSQSSIQSITKLFHTITTIFNHQYLKQSPRTTRPEQPIFIVGMPRSGTSLLEQILSTHPAIFGAGEQLILQHIFQTIENFKQLEPNHLNQLAHQYLTTIKKLCPSSPYIIDKLPTNFLYLGLIELLFPKAKVIHIHRHPLDTCLSCFMQNFTHLEFANNLNTIAQFYSQYQRLMTHWQKVLSLPLIHIQYEQLVTHPEKITKQVLAFLELPWNEQCLHFHETKRLPNTASALQVKQPIYTTSIGRHEAYKDFIQPLKDTLANELISEW